MRWRGAVLLGAVRARRRGAREPDPVLAARQQGVPRRRRRTTATCARSRSPRIAARSPIATASRSRSARRSTRSSANPTRAQPRARSHRRARRRDAARTRTRSRARSRATSAATSFICSATCRPRRREKVMALGLPGVSTVREYHRYYPAGEVVGHLLGFTDIDDRGQEGLEAEFDQLAQGRERQQARAPGPSRPRDRRRRAASRAARPGRDLSASIDLRLQYLAYRELKAMVTDTRARSGTVVVLDPSTGEVLAMVNQPSLQPERSLAARSRSATATARSPTSSSRARASSRS